MLANSKAWHNAMQSEHVKRMAIAQSLLKGDGGGASAAGETSHVDGSGTRKICK